MAKHKQELVQLRCGVRSEVDVKIAPLIALLNHRGIETRHSCQGTKRTRAYVSMFATPQAKRLAQFLIMAHDDVPLAVEMGVHPHGYEDLVLRFPKRYIGEMRVLALRFFIQDV